LRNFIAEQNAERIVQDNFKTLSDVLKNVGLIFLIGLFVNLIIIATPGFYSHDELDWRNRIARNDYPWSFGLGDFTTSPFFRLLGTTFVSLSLRLPLQPFTAHLTEVLLCVVTACLLYLTVAQFKPDRAFASAIIFMLTPSFAYSAGWIAAEYDVQFTLLGVLSVLCGILYWRGGQTLFLVVSVASFAIGLGCKETALSIPICAALVAFVDRDRVDRRRFAIISGLVGAIILLYLGLSAARIYRMSMTAGGGYRFGSGGQILGNAMAYFGFPFTSGMIEIGSTPISDYRKAITRIGPHVVLIGIIFFRGGPKWVLVYLVGFYATLLPVLPISKYETQYTYASSIALAVALAIVWRRQWVVALPILGLMAILITHSFAIQTRTYETGVCQTRALETLAAVLPELTTAQPLAVLIADDTPWWVIARAVHDNSFPIRGEFAKVSVTRAPEEAGMVFHKDCRISVLGNP
jgi:Dolichyl-phosphate-mannose-protein mannosyltransferase